MSKELRKSIMFQSKLKKSLIGAGKTTTKTFE